MQYNDFKKEILKNKKIKKAYEEIDLAFEVGKKIAEARILKNITQEKLAEMIKTKQPSIARIESGVVLPNLRFLKKISKALNISLNALLPIESDSITNTTQENIRYFPIYIYVGAEAKESGNYSNQFNNKIINLIYDQRIK